MRPSLHFLSISVFLFPQYPLSQLPHYHLPPPWKLPCLSLHSPTFACAPLIPRPPVFPQPRLSWGPPRIFQTHQIWWIAYLPTYSFCTYKYLLPTSPFLTLKFFLPFQGMFFRKNLPSVASHDVNSQCQCFPLTIRVIPPPPRKPQDTCFKFVPMTVREDALPPGFWGGVERVPGFFPPPFGRFRVQVLRGEVFVLFNT